MIEVRFEDTLKISGRRIGRLEQMIAALISATVHREAEILSNVGSVAPAAARRVGTRITDIIQILDGKIGFSLLHSLLEFSRVEAE